MCHYHTGDKISHFFGRNFQAGSHAKGEKARTPQKRCSCMLKGSRRDVFPERQHFGCVCAPPLCFGENRREHVIPGGVLPYHPCDGVIRRTVGYPGTKPGSHPGRKYKDRLVSVLVSILMSKRSLYFHVGIIRIDRYPYQTWLCG